MFQQLKKRFMGRNNVFLAMAVSQAKKQRKTGHKTGPASPCNIISETVLPGL